MHRDGHPINLGPNPGRLTELLKLIWLPLMWIDYWGATHRDLSQKRQIRRQGYKMRLALQLEIIISR